MVIVMISFGMSKNCLLKEHKIIFGFSTILVTSSRSLSFRCNFKLLDFDI